jgi:hypothetical protein
MGTIYSLKTFSTHQQAESDILKDLTPSTFLNDTVTEHMQIFDHAKLEENGLIDYSNTFSSSHLQFTCSANFGVRGVLSQSYKIILKVVSPKEKHLDQRIQNEITIRQYDGHLFCPVMAVHSYMSRHTHRPRQPSTSCPSSCLHYLFAAGYTRWPSTGLRTGISNHIKSVMSLLPRTRGSERLRVCALWPIRALLAAASVDDIMSHGNWPIQACAFLSSVFKTRSKFIFLVLGTSECKSNTLEQQSHDSQNEVLCL